MFNHKAPSFFFFFFNEKAFFNDECQLLFEKFRTNVLKNIVFISEDCFTVFIFL